MLSLHTNAASLFTKSNLTSTQNGLTTSLTRLGTGLRINSAMDDAAGLQIATRLDAQSRGMGMAMRNAQNGISMLQTAEGALNEVSNLVMRIKDLAVQGSDAGASMADKTAMQAEADALQTQAKAILDNTTFGGQTLFTGAGSLTAAKTFQIGDKAADTYAFNASTQLTAVSGAGISTTADVTANGTITTLSTAIDNISALRSTIGAGANRLQSAYNNLANVNNNTQIAKGRIMDTDYASESASMTSKQMLMQAGTSMLKQSGSMSQLAMSLLQ